MGAAGQKSRVGLVSMVAVVAVALVAPAAGHAAVTTFGSDLSAPANSSETHGVDSVFWSLALPGGRRTTVPANGQITTIRLKGGAIQNSAPGASAPLTDVHFQVLHPGAGGSVTVSLTSGIFNVPSGSNPNQITSYKPVNLCARAGDYVAFNDSGGFDPQFYPQGVPYQVFSRVPGATTGFFSKGNGTNNGATFTGAPHEGQELLMQMDLATGSDASPVCPQDGSLPAFGGLVVARETVRVSRGVGRIAVSCPPAAKRRCVGKLAIISRNRIGAKRRTLARARVSIRAGQGSRVRFRLTSGAARLLRRRGSLAAVAKAVVRDGSGAKRSSSVKFRLQKAR